MAEREKKEKEVFLVEQLAAPDHEEKRETRVLLEIQALRALQDMTEKMVIQVQKE
jgi:hypothetical protein